MSILNKLLTCKYRRYERRNVRGSVVPPHIDISMRDRRPTNADDNLSYRSRTGRRLSSVPLHRSRTEHILHRSAARKDIIPSNPCFIPTFAIHLQTLDIWCTVAITPIRSDREILTVAETDRHRFEPRSQDKERSLAGQRVETDHLPLWRLSVQPYNSAQVAA